ncbi:MAG: CHAT domain-containing protein [Cyanobacteria bacterium CRU_2_1]|nr:CHAT domain-containing protein [Cyanobacteria bacterium CRU_2_1]
MSKIRVLFLAANPVDTIQLRLDEEIRSITQKIRASEHRDSLQLISAWATRPDDLLQLLNEHKPHIVHFSGHGSRLGEIVLVDGSGASKAVSTSALKALFATLKDNLKVIILNSCYSRSQASAITEVVDCAIGMNAAVGDSSAIIFAASFYRALGFGRSIQESFDQGITALMLEGIGEENVPELITSRAIDPSRVFFVNSLVQQTSDENELALSISVSNEFSSDSFYNSQIKAENSFDLKRTLSYQICEEEQETKISFSMDYLTKLNNNGEISDIDTGVLICPQSFFKWQFPKLDLRLVNNSSKTIFITDVILDVEESVLDPSPVILLPKSEPNIFHFALLNVGWGSIQDSLVRYNLIPWGESFRLIVSIRMR